MSDSASGLPEQAAAPSEIDGSIPYHQQVTQQAKLELHEFLTKTRIRLRAIAQSVAEYNAIKDAKAMGEMMTAEGNAKYLSEVTSQVVELESQPDSSETAANTINEHAASMESRGCVAGKDTESHVPDAGLPVRESPAVMNANAFDDEMVAPIDSRHRRQDHAGESIPCIKGLDPMERLQAIKLRLAKQIEES